MKSIQYNSYGSPEVLEVNANVPKPTLKPGQILVENKAASINAFDWKLRSGYFQKMIPLTFPVSIGGDFAGVVVEVNGDAGFEVGDEVYGQAIVLNGGSGSMAELVAANGKNTALKPKSVRFDQAGALPLAGVSAVQGLEEHIKLQKGQKILIHGGAGGIGHMAIQYAKSLGAHVATTVGTKDVQFVKSLGADEVIDYKTQKFEEILKDFEAVFDTVGGETLVKSYGVVKKGGILVSMGQVDEELAKEHAISAFGQGTKTDTEHLQHLTQLVESGKIKVHIDKTFPLTNAREAFTYQETGHPQGKVVVTI